MVARARAAGVGRMVTISTRVKKHAQVLAVAEKFPDVFCSVGTHPHNAQEELDIDAKALIALAQASESRGDRRGRARLSLRQQPARRCRRKASASTSPRRAKPDCRWSSIRATATPTWRAFCEEETGKGAFPAVLHCFTGGRDLAFKAIELGPLHLVHRHPHLQEFAKTCATSPRSCRPTAFWSRPTRPIWRRCRTAANATSRPMWWKPPRCWRRRAACRLDEIARQTTENFFRLFSKVPRNLGERRMSLTFTILGCGSSMGVPRVALGWGACDPEQSEEPPAALLAYWSSARARKGTARACWSTARRICASSCSRPRSTGSTAC